MSSLRHGYTSRRMGRNPTYVSWVAIIGRCTNPNNPKYPRYGGRGIAVCERWLKFDNFLADMGDRPAGLSIDRVDNDGHYEPSNCKWSTPAEQSRNRGHNWLTADTARAVYADKRRTREIALDFGVPDHVVRHVKAGLTWRGIAAPE